MVLTVMHYLRVNEKRINKTSKTKFEVNVDYWKIVISTDLIRLSTSDIY